MGGTDAAERVGTGASGTKRVSSVERRRQYLAIAARLVTSLGAEAVTMEAVATEASVNKVLLYRQFSNRNELLLALFEQEAADLDGRLQRALESAGDFEGRVRAWAHQYFSYMGRRGTLYFRLVDAARTIASSTAAQPHRDRQRRIIAAHAKAYAGEYGIGLEEAADAAALLYAGLAGAIERWVASPTSSTRARLEATYVDAVLGTLERLARR